MLKTVIIAQDPTDPTSWTEAEVENIHEHIRSEIGEWTTTTKLYHGSVDAQHDVTPFDEAGISALDNMPGPFYLVQYPEWVAIPYIIAAIALILSVVAMNSVPKAVTTDNNTPSPNNALTDRQNIARPFKRIPDIYGTVRSTPDLIMVPYSEYVSNIEYEHAYMCVGRGQYTIFDCLDDTTPISTIDGASAVIMGPNDSPNIMLPAPIPPGRTYFGLGQMSPVVNVTKCSSVNGQDLATDSESDSIGTSATMHFSMSASTGNGTIVFSGGEDLSDISAGDKVYLYCVAYKTHHTTHDIYLSGTYTVFSCTSDTLVLANVQSVANDWGWLEWVGEFVITDSHIVESIKLAIGPFLLTANDQTDVWINIVADSGLYQIDSDGTVTPVNVDFSATIQPTDSTGNPDGTPYKVTVTVPGDAKKYSIGYTWKISLTTAGPCTVSVVRTSDSPRNSQVADSCKWKDLYGMSPVTTTGDGFGDVTTVYSITKATEGALAVKERKLNMLVQRKLPYLLSDYTFDNVNLAGTNSAADIICAMALDSKVGNRTIAELDVQQIYNEVAKCVNYFGSPQFGEFCYTFDDDNTSFEEMVSAVASAIFSNAYRQGNQMRLHFEGATDDAVLLLGHRNILPDTQQRVIAFGNENNYDSVSFNYVSPDDESQVTLYIPAQGSVPSQITSVGIRNYPQAYAAAWRAWNKIKYTNTTVTCTATQEAAMLLLADCVLIADNTRSNAMDGEVVAQNVLELQLSQPYSFVSGKSYSIFLQGVEGQVESIPVSPGPSEYTVLLTSAPTVTLNLDPDGSARTLYWIVPNDDVRSQMFLISDREPADGFTEKITAVNYDARYYANDLDNKSETIPPDPNRNKSIIPVDRGSSSI